MTPAVQTSRAERFIRLLKKRLTSETVRHCISTAEFMSAFAAEAGITEDQALDAGLLHDLCKGMDGRGLLRAACRYGIEVNDAQRARPKLLHGAVSAEECRRTGLIADEDVYEAIYWHTTGRPHLGPVGLALYFADFAEPSRTFSQAAEARALLVADGFEAAVRFVSVSKLERVRGKRHCDPMTEAFNAWLETHDF